MMSTTERRGSCERISQLIRATGSSSTHIVSARPSDAEILEVHGPGGTPPFRVRWSDTGNVALYFPGEDASVDHLTERRHGPTRETSPVA